MPEQLMMCPWGDIHSLRTGQETSGENQGEGEKTERRKGNIEGWVLTHVVDLDQAVHHFKGDAFA